MNLYRVTLRHNRSHVKITVRATDRDMATALVCKAENAPLRAVVQAKELRTAYHWKS